MPSAMSDEASDDDGEAATKTVWCGDDSSGGGVRATACREEVLGQRAQQERPALGAEAARFSRHVRRLIFVVNLSTNSYVTSRSNSNVQNSQTAATTRDVTMGAAGYYGRTNAAIADPWGRNPSSLPYPPPGRRWWPPKRPGARENPAPSSGVLDGDGEVRTPSPGQLRASISIYQRIDRRPTSH